MPGFDISDFINKLIQLFAAITALTLHEFAHAFSAYRLGDPTAKNQGRMSVNPMRHVRPLNLLIIIVLYVLIGLFSSWIPAFSKALDIMFLAAWVFMARPVPVNPFNLRPRKWGGSIVSACGPLSNFLLAIVSAALFVVFFRLTFQWYDNTFISYISLFLSYLCYICITLGIFNLFPIPPLDGFGVIEPFFNRETREMIYRYYHFFMIGIFLLISSGLTSQILGTFVPKIYSGLIYFFDMIFGWIG